VYEGKDVADQFDRLRNRQEILETTSDKHGDFHAALVSGETFIDSFDVVIPWSMIVRESHNALTGASHWTHQLSPDSASLELPTKVAFK